jgi:hypothetical protein
VITFTPGTVVAVAVFFTRFDVVGPLDVATPPAETNQTGNDASLNRIGPDGIDLHQ